MSVSFPMEIAAGPGIMVCPKKPDMLMANTPLRIGLGDIFTDLQRGNQTEIVREVTIG
jgi:hypothetical protein